MYSNPRTVIAENAPNIFRRNISVYPELSQYIISHIKDPNWSLILITVFLKDITKNSRIYGYQID